MLQIMIVDDETMSQEIIKRYIDTYLPQYHVSCICNNGHEALSHFRQNPIDIVLADIHMPIMNGLTLISELNKITTDYVPIIISGYGEFEYAKSAMSLGVNYYLLKPLDFTELNDCLFAAEHTLNSNRFLHTNINWLEENQEIFFSNLLNGLYQTKELALNHFCKLSFPFSYENANGIYIQINIQQSHMQTYEEDYLHTAIKNLLKLIYLPQYLIALFKQDNKCNYLLVTENSSQLSFEDLYVQCAQILGTEITLNSLLVFTSLEDIRTQNIITSKDVLEENDTELLKDESIKICIEKAIAYMKEHYAEDLTREDVAEKVYMSGAHFSRCFKIVMHTTYKDYLTEIRMQKAIELLKTNARIQDIAKQVGYPSPNRFNINFRHYTSYTPSEYRIKVLKII